MGLNRLSWAFSKYLMILNPLGNYRNTFGLSGNRKSSQYVFRDPKTLSTSVEYTKKGLWLYCIQYANTFDIWKS